MCGRRFVSSVGAPLSEAHYVEHFVMSCRSHHRKTRDPSHAVSLPSLSQHVCRGVQGQSPKASSVGPAQTTGAPPVCPAQTTGAPPVCPAQTTVLPPVGPAQTTGAPPVCPAQTTVLPPVSGCPAQTTVFSIFIATSLLKGHVGRGFADTIGFFYVW